MSRNQIKLVTGIETMVISRDLSSEDAKAVYRPLPPTIPMIAPKRARMTASQWLTMFGVAAVASRSMP
jgi:hypothetical protein